MRNNLSKVFLALAAVLGLAMSLNAGANELRLRSGLSGAAIEGLTPSGHADFRAREGRMRLNVQVEDVNLPAGTEVTVSLVRDMTKTVIGTITIGAAPIRGGEFERNSQDGEAVPTLQKGDMIVVEGPSGILLAGAL